MSELLALVRTVKNSFVAINRIPPEVLSLVPAHWDKCSTDRDIIKLTHVCHGWREIFISHSSLWTHLHFTDVDKTRTYIQRSKLSLLDIHLGCKGGNPSLDYANPSIITHLCRLESLTISTDILPRILQHLCFQAPYLKKIDIEVSPSHSNILEAALFNGDLSSLRELSLMGVATHLPWRNPGNLKVLYLSIPEGQEVTVTRLLDFFESAPFLHTASIADSIPELSDAPTRRVVPLHHLKKLVVNSHLGHLILKHLGVPVGASLKLWASFSGEKSPLPDYLPETSLNLRNLSNITSVNLSFHYEDQCVELIGPSGSLLLYVDWENEVIPSSTMDRRALRSINPRILSTTQRLAISGYAPHDPASDEQCPVFLTLSSTNDLQTLILAECDNRPFIFALNPEKNRSKRLLCPNLKKLVFCVTSWDFTGYLISMVKRRALKGAKLSSIMMVGLHMEFPPEGVVLGLRKHVTNVEEKIKFVAFPQDRPLDPGESGEGFWS